MYLPSDTGLEWPREGPLFELKFELILGALFESPLGRYLCQAWGPWPDKAPV